MPSPIKKTATTNAYPMHSPACLVMHIIVAALLFVASLAALVGVYKAHVLDDALIFGTTSGSLSLVAFVASIHFFVKAVKKVAGPYCPGCSSCSC